jgi:hypothetical protein
VELEIKNTLPLKMKYLDTNPINCEQDIYEKIYKTMKKINELQKWEDFLFVGGKLNIVKMSFLPNLIYRFNAIVIKITSYFVNIDKLIIKFTW